MGFLGWKVEKVPGCFRVPTIGGFIQFPLGKFQLSFMLGGIAPVEMLLGIETVAIPTEKTASEKGRIPVKKPTSPLLHDHSPKFPLFFFFRGIVSILTPFRKNARGRTRLNPLRFSGTAHKIAS